MTAFETETVAESCRSPAKYEREFDPKVEAATLLGDYEAKSSRWSGWSAVRRLRSSS